MHTKVIRRNRKKKAEPNKPVQQSIHTKRDILRAHNLRLIYSLRSSRNSFRSIEFGSWTVVPKQRTSVRFRSTQPDYDRWMLVSGIEISRAELLRWAGNNGFELKLGRQYMYNGDSIKFVTPKRFF